MANSIKFDVGFNVNQSDLNALVSSLRKVQTDMQKASAAGTLTTELQKSAEAAKQLEGILNQAWNSKLGQLDLSKVNASIQNTYGSVKNLKAAMEQSGAAGAAAYNQFASSVLNTNIQIKQSSQLLDKMAVTFKNTVRYGISSSIFNNLTGALEKAYHYSIKLDTSLNDIRIVTDKSASDMERFAQQANKASKQMGASTLDYTNAALIYYQQGLSDEETAARAETTIKAANVTGQTGQEVSEQLTAVWNGYKVTAEETELYVDKLAAVAATTASDLEELSTGMSKVASAANAMGVDFDDLNAQIATIVSVTRQAPESVGTALKTIYARLGDLKVGGVDEFGVSLGKVGEQMAQMGIQILDQNGNLRDMTSIIAEVAEKWDGWTSAQRQAAAVAMAGKRQYNNLIALFDNWDMYTDALNTSVEAVGTLQHQQDIYMESTEAHLQKLKTEAENTYDILFDTDSVNTMSDAMTGLLHIFNNFISGVGGGISALTSLGAIATRVFSQQIGAGLGNMVLNMQKAKDNADMLILKQQVIDAHAAQGDHVGAKAAEAEAEIMQKTLAVAKGLTDEEYNQLMTYQKEIGLLTERLDYLSGYEQVYNKLYGEGKANAAVLEAEAAEQQNITNGIKEQIQYFGQLQKEHSKIVLEDEARIALQTRLSALQASDVITEEQKEALIKASNDIEKTSGLTQENIKNILVIQNQLLEQQVQYENEIKQAAEGARAAESGETQEIQNQINATRNLVDVEHEVANTRMKMADAVTALSTITMMITSLSGIVKTLGDDSLTTGEKLERVFTTLLFALPMVLTSIGPIVSTMSNLAIALAGEAGAAAAAAGVNFTLGESFMIVAGAAGSFLLEVLPFIAIGAGLVAVGVAIYNAWTKDARAAEKAAETAKALGEAYEETKQRTEELANAFDGYTSAIETLEECTRGTQEWNDALSAVNDSVAEILSKYPELLNKQGLFEHTAEGIRINTALMQEAIDEANQAVANTQVAMVQGQVNAQKAQVKSDTTDLSRDSIYYDDVGNAIQVGATAIGNAVDAINENSALLEMDASELANAAGISEAEASALLANKVALEELASSSAALAIAQENAAALTVAQVDEFKNADDATLELAKGNYDELYQDAYDSWLDATHDGIAIWSEANNENVKKVWDAYTDALGQDLKLVSDNAVRGTDGNRSFAYEDANGEEREVTDDEIAQTIAAAEALKELGNTASDIAQTLRTVDDNAGKFSEGIKGWIGSRDLGSMTSDEISGLKDKIGDTSDLATVQTYLEEIFGGAEKLADVAQQMNFDSVEDMAEAFQTSVEGYDEAIQKVKDEVAKFGLEDIFDELDASDLTLDGQKAIANILEKAISLGGEEAAKAVELMYKNVPKDQIEDFVSSFNDIDWNTVSKSELDKTLKEVGINADNLGIDLDNLIFAMQESGSGFEALSSQYAEINSILKDLEQGDTISADDYAKLGDAAEDYFIKMLDGTYKLVGDADQFYKTVQKEYIDKFAKENSRISTDNENLNKVSNYDFNSLATSQVKEANGKNIYNTSDVQKQIELIELLGDKSEDTAKKIQAWRTDLADNHIQVQTLQEIANAVEECRSSFEGINDKVKENEAALLQNQLAIAFSAQSYSDLKDLLKENAINQDAFNVAVENMELEERLEDLDTEKLEEYADYLQELAKSSEDVYIGSEKLSDEIADNEEAAEDLAIQIERMNEGVEDLADNWKDWSSVLKKSSKGSEEYAEALIGTKEALSDLLDVSEDFISEDFISDNLDLISEAAKGSGEAIDELKSKLADDIVANIIINNGFTQDSEGYLGLMADYEALKASIPDIEVGATINDGDFLTKAQQLIEDAGMTVEQTNAMFDALGFEADFATKEEMTEQKVPKTVTKTEITGYTTGTAEMPQPDGTTSEVNWQYPILSQTTHNDGYSIEKGLVEVPAMATNGKTPIMRSLRKKAGGSANNYSGSNRGGGSPGKTSGGKKGGGGKGKKGGGKGKEKEKKERQKSEYDRYYKLNNAIDSVTRAIDKLNKAEENLAGNALANKLDKENGLLNKQIKAYKNLAKEQKKETNEIKKRLKNKGGRFDEDGNLTNYKTLYKKELKAYNEAIKKYNKSAQEKADKKALEKAQKRYEKFKDDVEKYEATKDAWLDTKEQIKELKLQKKALKLEAWDIRLQVKLDKKQFKRDWYSFLEEINDDFKMVQPDLVAQQDLNKKQWKTYLGKNGTLAVDKQRIEDIEKEIELFEKGDKNSGKMYASLSKAKEALKEAKEQYMNDVQAFNELRQKAWDALLEGIEQAADQFDTIQEKYDKFNDTLEFQKELIELMYGDEAYDKMDAYYKAQETATIGQIDSLKQERDFWYDQLDATGALEKNRSEWTKEELKYYEEWQEAEEKLNDKVLEHIRLLKEDYNNTIKQTLKTLETAITGSTLKDIEDQWDRISEKSNKYLDNVEKAYKVQTLANKIDQEINNTKNLKNQQKLKKLRDEEINALKEKDNLTEYDLQRAEAKYEIALKELALENTKNNKTSMKLVRNEQGNWSYQYIADASEVEKKQQDLYDSIYKLYELADNAYTENLKSIQDLQSKFLQSLQEIYENENLSEEEKNKKSLELRDQYEEDYNLLVEENTQYREDLRTSSAAVIWQTYKQDKTNYKDMTDKEKELIDGLTAATIGDYSDLETKVSANFKNLKTASDTNLSLIREDWGSKAQELANLWKNDEGTSVKDAIDVAFKAIENGTKLFNEKKKELENTSGIKTGWEDIKKEIEGVTTALVGGDGVDGLNSQTKKLVDELTKEDGPLATLKKAVLEIEDAWNKVYEAMIKVNTGVDVNLKAKTGDKKEKSEDDKNKYGIGGVIEEEKKSTKKTTDTKKNDSKSSNSNDSSNSSKAKGVASAIYYLSNYGGWGSGNTRKTRLKEKKIDYNDVQDYFNGKNGKSLSQLSSKNAAKYKYGAFKTGGYTGEWGEEGRWAMLHQKELVLNADDTKNFLEGINTIRDMASLNGSISDSIAKAVANMILTLGNKKLGNFNSATDESTQNVFNITAEFPNAENVNEIRQAILSLPNLAAQFASKNKK